MNTSTFIIPSKALLLSFRLFSGVCFFVVFFFNWIFVFKICLAIWGQYSKAEGMWWTGWLWGDTALLTDISVVSKNTWGVYVSVGKKPDKPACLCFREVTSLCRRAAFPSSAPSFCMWISPMAEWSKLLSLAGILPREIMKGLLCQQRTKCYQCNLMKSKKEGMARAALILGYICLVFFRLLGWEMAEITEGHSPVS